MLCKVCRGDLVTLCVHHLTSLCEVRRFDGVVRCRCSRGKVRNTLPSLGDLQLTMPTCSNAGCNTKQAILNPGDLCKTCYAALETNDPLKDLDLTKPLKNINLGELVDIFKALMNPIEQKLEVISKRTISQDAKIALLEANLKEKDTTIATMTDIIVNMQSSLNRIDANMRNTNIIVAGLHEGDIKDDDVGELKGEKKKIERLLKVMDVEAKVLAGIDYTL